MAVVLFDANGVVDVLCRRLEALAVDYIDLAALPLDAGFRGSALISAVAWQHPVGGTGRGPERNLVGLGAVLITRRDSNAGDALGATVGQPLSRVPASLAGDAGDQCRDIATATPPTPTSPTATATGTATAGATSPTPSATTSGTPPATATGTAPQSTATATTTPTATSPATAGPSDTPEPTATEPASGRFRVLLPFALQRR